MNTILMITLIYITCFLDIISCAWHLYVMHYVFFMSSTKKKCLQLQIIVTSCRFIYTRLPDIFLFYNKLLDFLLFIIKV